MNNMTPQFQLCYLIIVCDLCVEDRRYNGDQLTDAHQQRTEFRARCQAATQLDFISTLRSQLLNPSKMSITTETRVGIQSDDSTRGPIRSTVDLIAQTTH